jgi:hypothetical protein
MLGGGMTASAINNFGEMQLVNPGATVGSAATTLKQQRSAGPAPTA